MFTHRNSRSGRKGIAALAALALTILSASLALTAPASAQSASPARPKGPCDIYAAAGNPCVAAHSSTRALYAQYDGPLYRVQRLSDSKVRDIGVVPPSAKPVADAGGYADSSAQDKFCADTTCFITVLYDQSPMHNDLTQAPRGGFSGPGMGGFNNYPIADMAPVTVSGHKAYGVFIEPGMGLRDNDTKGVAVDDQAEGTYWVINGQHYNDGCCFDYGNAETDSRDDGNGTMETTYYGNATAWYHGDPPGPWIMTDQENNLVGCVNPGSTSKLCVGLPSIDSRFVTAVAKGEPHHWASLGGDAQQGALSTMFDGPRVDASYDPMRKQGAILLGNGGDNSVGSQGTFYEGVMTTGYPTDATDNKVQANVVAAGYEAPQLTLAPATAVNAPPGLQTFAPKTAQQVSLSYTNTSDAKVGSVSLALAVPAGWKAKASGKSLFPTVKPGQTVSTTFTVTSGQDAFNGDLTGSATWTDLGSNTIRSTSTAEKVRNIGPIKINEFRTRTAANSTDQFIELYNAGDTAVDISQWTVTEHPTQQAVSSKITIPAQTSLEGGGHYVLGLATSGLAAPAQKGDSTVNVRSTTGLTAGDHISVDNGGAVETRTITNVGTAATANTPLWQPQPDGPITIPAGSTNVPVTSVAGFTVGQKLAIGYGSKREVGIVTAVGKPGTQGRLSAPAAVGATNIKVTTTTNISVGDTIRLDIGSKIETVTVAAVGTSGGGGTGLDLTAPLTIAHSSNLPFSVRGTGVSFVPATAYPHSSNEPIQALGSGVTLDKPLKNKHALDAPVRDSGVTTAGFQATVSPDQFFGGPALSTSAGNIVVADGNGLIADSVNYGLLVDPWTAEGYQAASGSGASGCRVATPGTGRSAVRFPDGTDTDSNCSDFTATNSPTPGTANQGFALDPGPLVSLQATAAGSTSEYIKHNASDDLIVTAVVTDASSAADKQAATWVKTAGLNDPSCFSFESIDKPGSYLRHQNYQFHLATSDGSALFNQDSTFCQVAGNSGQGVSFQSVNFPTRYIRALNHLVYLASNGGTQAGDSPVNWAEDSTWVLADPWGSNTPSRPQGPCDIYAAGGTPCVTAHSTTRALFSGYDGPLYQVKRTSDDAVKDIGLVAPAGPPSPDAGGYADAAAQDAFCAQKDCVISVIYDQSGHGNDLLQAPPGRFVGTEPGGYDTLPIADMAPITIGGHPAYGAFIMPGMGFRNNNAVGLAKDDEPEGIYYVIDGSHYDSGCCFDYGNSSTNSRAVGTGTMETTYFGTATAWGSGSGPGPWVMSDMEAGLFTGYDAKQNVGSPTIDSTRFLTAVVDGGGGNQWDLRGGDAQNGPLSTYYSGIRPGSLTNSSYYPMHRKGAVLLGTGGDNGNGSSGTFYEGVMTTGYPTEATTDAVQANVVAAQYDVQRVSLSRATTFTPGTSQEVTETFTNTTGSVALGVTLGVKVPAGWTAVVPGTRKTSVTFARAIAPGESVNATFAITAAKNTGSGFMTAQSSWTNPVGAIRGRQSAVTSQALRNADPVKINEVRFRTSTNSTDQFIELYNSSAKDVDISGWTITNTPSQSTPATLATIPTGTTLDAGQYYLLGLSNSGLAAPVDAGSATINVRSVTGIVPDQQINVDTGTKVETRSVVSVGTAASAETTLFVPVSTGPWLTVPAGSTNVPVTNAAGFTVGDPIRIGANDDRELATVTGVGKASTQTTLSVASAAGETNLKLAADANITVGDTITVDTGANKEVAQVTAVGTTGASGTGVDVAAPLQFAHAIGVDTSDQGTGISFSPATSSAHRSGTAVQALGSGITLDSGLSSSHEAGAAVLDPLVTSAGYQGSPAPKQLFGGALSTSAGSLALRDATGDLVVDAFVYGSQQSSSSGNGTITSPELAVLEGDQGGGGCMAVVAGSAASPGRSNARWPNGNDTDNLCHDVVTTTIPTPGAANLK